MSIKKKLKGNKFFCYLYAFIKVLRNSNSKSMDKTIETYLSDKKNDKKYIRKMKYILHFCRLYYEISFAEYFLFDYEKLSDKGRKEFIGDRQRVRMCNALLSAKTKSLFNNKYETYTAFKPFFKREVVFIQSKDDFSIFTDFIHKHNICILKPSHDSFGNGVKLVDSTKNDFNVENFFNEVIEKGPFVLEERIEQVPEMAAFHPESCNTVRYTTFLKNDKVYHLFSFLRMGLGSSIVDNAGAGGILATIDIDTGIVKTPGVSEKKVSFLRHPNTDVQILGFQIPKWDELKIFVEQLARVVPEQKYIGWDLALTKDGWVVVEGNCRGQFVFQYAEGVGIKKEIEEIFLTK